MSQKKPECIFSFFASDNLATYNPNSTKIKTRKSINNIIYEIYPTKYKTKLKEVFLLDNETNIAFIPLGYPNKKINKPENKLIPWKRKIELVIRHTLLWPNQYTVIFWIRFRDIGLSIATTFDSSTNAPLYCYKANMGVASSSS